MNKSQIDDSLTEEQREQQRQMDAAYASGIWSLVYYGSEEPASAEVQS